LLSIFRLDILDGDLAFRLASAGNRVLPSPEVGLSKPVAANRLRLAATP